MRIFGYACLTVAAAISAWGLGWFVWDLWRQWRLYDNLSAALVLTAIVVVLLAFVGGLAVAVDSE